MLDENPPALEGIFVDGDPALRLNKDLVLSSRLYRCERVTSRSAQKHSPFAHKAVINLTTAITPIEKTDIEMCGTKVLSASLGGKLNLHGTDGPLPPGRALLMAPPQTLVITEHYASKSPLQMANVGDEMVIVSTDFDPNQAERRHHYCGFTGWQTYCLLLQIPSKYMHWGEIMSTTGHSRLISVQR